MTILVGAAALLAVGAAVTLVLGWSSDDAVLVWVSILASGFAALFLFAASRAASQEDD
ncbi:MAG TPA: hypothetical protein VEU29_07230 [Actinomycetota bacterium]|nr:hypothetical protein [Actinomycetota bacterium]